MFVSYGTRNTAVDRGKFVQQQVSSSYDGGASFGRPLSLGPRSNLKYAAVAGGEFPGDYIGASATAARLNLVWCVSSKALSQRELEVLGLVARGAGNRDAARRLFISEATVKTHLMHIYAKLGVNDRAAAVAAAYDRGLLTPGENRGGTR